MKELRQTIFKEGNSIIDIKIFVNNELNSKTEHYKKHHVSINTHLQVP